MTLSPFAPFMRHAVALAEQGRFAVHPNPTVGAVLVHQGQIVAQGWHKKYGGPHAEVECLQDAAAKGVDPAHCVLVVTLEPCHHQGQTPPCTAAIVAAGIKHVVIGLADPNPQAAGGADFLQAQGITVERGVEEELCRDLVADFVLRQTSQRPYVILKLASTLDGRIGTRTGQSRWISCEESRLKVQELRAGIAHCGGAVLIGGGTFRADNPHLTVRDAHGGHSGPQPLACVLTSRLPAATSANFLVQERPGDTIFFTPPAVTASPGAQSLRDLGIRVWASQAPNEQDNQHSRTPNLTGMLTRLRQDLGCTYVMCEGGGKLALCLLEAGLVDEFRLHLAPCILGDNASRPVFDGRSPLQMTEALSLRLTHHTACGQDLHITLRPR